MRPRVHGTFLFLVGPRGRKVFELRCLNTWPLVMVRSDVGYRSTLQTPNETIRLSTVQHLSIPPDYNIHFTGSGERLFFKAPSALPARLFSFVSRDVDTYPCAQGRWKGGVVVTSLPARGHGRRFLLDFYIHDAGVSKGEILALPPSEWGAEYIGLSDGNCIGPFPVPASATGSASIACSVRFGSCLTGEPDAETFLVPREREK